MWVIIANGAGAGAGAGAGLRAHAPSLRGQHAMLAADILHSAGMFAHQSNCLSHMAGPQECYYHVTISQVADDGTSKEEMMFVRQYRDCS